MVPLFTAAIFTAAFLLFLIQPLAARLILPQLGGSPAVWTGSMMFFQIVLLAGYAYAHAISALKPRIQGIIHAAVMLACIVFLPLALPAWWTPGSIHPLASLLLALVGSAGLPFFAISATSPLLQSWFARTGHRRAHDPYFLYAASNAGSLLGLLAYPILVEPTLGLHAQGWAWAAGFALCALLVGASWAFARPSRTAPAHPVVAPIVEPGAIQSNAKRSTNPANNRTRGPKPASKSQRTTTPRPAPKPTNNPPSKLAPDTPAAPSTQGTPSDLTWTRRATWIILAAVPSSLSLGVTQFLSTDVAAIPLLWVIPLAIYLITYILAFSKHAPVAERVGRILLPAATIAASAAIMTQAVRPLSLIATIHLVMFAAGAMYCHGRLAALRPHASRLTEFYLLASLGGALGGAFNALVAPVAFTVVLEYPLAIAASCALLLLAPRTPGRRWFGLLSPKDPILRGTHDRRSPADALAPAPAPSAIKRALSALAHLTGPSAPLLARLIMPLLAVLLASAYLILADAALAYLGYDAGRRLAGVPGVDVVMILTVAVPLIATFLLARFRLVFAALIATLAGQAAIVPFAGTRLDYDIIHVERSFFGVAMVVDRQPFATRDGLIVPSLRVLRHGTTTHGQQFLDPEKRFEPLSYYARIGPVGNAFDKLPQTPRTIATIGLGAGSVAAYGRPGDTFDFFEIDPAVVDIARDSALFSYLSDSPAAINVIVGDGRLKLAEQPEGRYDLIILDAFSSDAIPVHLLTTEALAIDKSRLRPGGILLVHISNRHFDLLPPVARAAADLGMHVAGRNHAIGPRESHIYAVNSSHWLALTADPARLAQFEAREGWAPIARPDNRPAWTDDHADVLSALRLD